MGVVSGTEDCTKGVDVIGRVVIDVVGVFVDSLKGRKVGLFVNTEVG